ncbi:MAG: ABC transporter substrate-binding protein [Candidatus Methylacidiphilales bacterium]|nr:ABC transporter substrate-binding protein [Candidatus Methylacidiphilales bacterium]
MPQLWRYLTALVLGLSLASCGKKTPPTEAPSGNQTAAEPAGNATASESGFFPKLLAPHPEHPREAEKQVFHIYYDLEGIPESWIEEWKAGRDLKWEQHALPTDTREWPKNADLIIAPPDRLVHAQLKMLPGELAALRANPVFLHHPFDPEQKWTRPWRWTPWVVMRHIPSPETAAPATGTGPGEMLWPDRPALLRSWWLKSLNRSANHVPNKALEEKWAAELTNRKPSPEPVDKVWEKLSAGQAPSALLPLAWKLRQPAAPAAWSIPPTGTVIHFDQLAMGSETDQPELVREWIDWLTDPARQKALLATTGYYPVQVPLGREIPDLPGPPSAWWDRSEFLVGESAPAAPVVVVPTPATPGASETQTPTPTPTPTPTANPTPAPTPTANPTPAPAPVQSVPGNTPSPPPAESGNNTSPVSPSLPEASPVH